MAGELETDARDRKNSSIVKTVAITAANRAELVDEPEPSAHGDIAKVNLRVIPMCTEFKSYGAGETTNRLGHEASGVVVDPGGSNRAHVGDRVVVMPQYGCGVCRYCTSGEHIYCGNQRDVLAETGSSYGTATFAEFLIKPDWLLLPVPEDISLRHAAMACCALGPSFNAIKAMQVSASDTLLVMGCGPVGLGAVINGVARGAPVISVDVNHYRLKLAERLGAVAGIDPTSPTALAEVRALTRGSGVDAIFDSTGVPEAVEFFEQLVHPLTRASFVVLGRSVVVEQARCPGHGGAGLLALEPSTVWGRDVPVNPTVRGTARQACHPHIRPGRRGRGLPRSIVRELWESVVIPFWGG